MAQTTDTHCPKHKIPYKETTTGIKFCPECRKDQGFNIPLQEK